MTTSQSHPMFREEALKKLQSPEQLDELMQLTSPRAWLAIGAVLALMAGALIWSIAATLETTTPGNGVLTTSADNANQIDAVLFVTLPDSYLIEPGMVVKISPANYPSQQFGLVLGEVTAVDTTPTDLADMNHILGSDTTTQALIAGGQLAQIHVTLRPDSSTVSGYAWTTTTGPTDELVPGVFSTASIVTDETRPIELIFARFTDRFK